MKRLLILALIFTSYVASAQIELQTIDRAMSKFAQTRVNSNFDIVQNKINENLGGSFAYLDSKDTTVVTTAGTYYDIVGDFTNSPIENFTAGEDEITYNGDGGYFEIDWHASIEKVSGTTTVTIAIARNDTTQAASKMSTIATTVMQQMSGTDVLYLLTDDEVSLTMTSTSSTDSVIVDYFTTTIRPWVFE